jgi:tight adherence protein B
MLMFLLVPALGFVAVAGFGLVFADKDDSTYKVTKRAQAISNGRKTEKLRGRAAAGPDAAGNRRKQIVQNLKAIEKQQRKKSLTLDSRLRSAGLNISVRTFWMFCGCLALLTAGIALVLHANPLISLGIAFAAGMGLPRWSLSFLAKRRVKKFTEEFPNATDVIVRGIKSGLPVHDCLKVIARESPQPLAGEFQSLVENMGLGLSIDQALEKMYDRMPTAELRFFSIVLAIQQKTGGNLAEALGNLSTVLRARKLMREKIKAMSGEAVASAFIIGCLPPGIMLLVLVTTPGYMMPMFKDPRGHMMLLGGAIWMGTGIFIMRRMINFKF